MKHISSNKETRWAGLLAFAFVAACVVGVSLALDGNEKYAIVLVAGYAVATGFIIAFARKDGSLNTPGIVDSPYFLGFILTLATLFRALDSVGEMVHPGRMLATIAMALVPTGVGLLGRQVITLLADAATPTTSRPLEDIRLGIEQVWKETAGVRDTLSGSLQRDEAAFQRLIEAFVSQMDAIRSDVLIADLHKVHSDAVDTLRAYGEAARLAQMQHAAAETTWKARVDDAIRKVDELNAHTIRSSEDMLAIVGDLRAKIDEASVAFGAVAKRISEPTSKLSGALADLAATTHSLQAALATHGPLVEQVSLTLRDAGSANEMATGAIARAADGVNTATVSLAKIPTAIDDTARKIYDAGTQLDAAVKAHIDPLHRDAREVDEILRDLTSILTKRVAELKVG